MADTTTDTATTQNSGSETTTSTTLLTEVEKPVEQAKPSVDPAKQAEQDAGKSKEGGEPEKAKEAAAGAPEKYEFTAPEGMTLDPAAIAAFEPLARELNLTQDQAQKLVNLQAGMVRAQAEQWQGTIKGWQDATKTDKEIGGAKLQESLSNAKAALKRYGTPELGKLLDDYGIGNHPEVVRAFAKIGRSMAEDKIINGGPAKAGAGNHFFPTTKRT